MSHRHARRNGAVRSLACGLAALACLGATQAHARSIVKCTPTSDDGYARGDLAATWKIEPYSMKSWNPTTGWSANLCEIPGWSCIANDDHYVAWKPFVPIERPGNYDPGLGTWGAKLAFYRRTGQISHNYISFIGDIQILWGTCVIVPEPTLQTQKF